MGILNITPDSFSEKGANFSTEVAVQAGLKMVDEGADIIDIGGESTRPGADPVSAGEEIDRVIPVIQGLRAKTSTPLSIDTYKSEVARLALENGADIINDISGFHRDKNMVDVAKEFSSGCIVMHMQGTPETMQNFTQYTDIILEISDFFSATFSMLENAGISRECVCIDPGIGFSKDAGQNLHLIKSLSAFSHFGRPILVGPSRKSFIGNVLNIDCPAERIWGTAAAVSVSLANGATLFRVHDVAQMKQVCEMTNAIINPE